jgi:hypothetical protein
MSEVVVIYGTCRCFGHDILLASLPRRCTNHHSPLPFPLHLRLELLIPQTVKPGHGPARRMSFSSIHFLYILGMHRKRIEIATLNLLFNLLRRIPLFGPSSRPIRCTHRHRIPRHPGHPGDSWTPSTRSPVHGPFFHHALSTFVITAYGRGFGTSALHLEVPSGDSLGMHASLAGLD